MGNTSSMDYVVVNNDTEECECFTALVDLAKRFDVKCKVIRDHMKNFPLMPFNGIYSITRQPKKKLASDAADISAAAAKEAARVERVLVKWKPLWEAAGCSDTVHGRTTPELARFLDNLPDDTKVVEGFNYHTISIDGTIINQRTKRVMRHMLRKRGLLVSITEPGLRNTTMDVRRLLAVHFLPNPDGHKYCQYESDDPCDLSLDKIAWKKA